MSIFQIIKNSQRNFIIFIVSYCLLLSLITYGIYSITKVKKKPSIDNVNNPIDEEKEEEKKEEGNKQQQEEENKKEEKTENEENNDNPAAEENENNSNEELIIYPTFFLDNRKTMIGLQCLIDTVFLIATMWTTQSGNMKESFDKYKIEKNKKKDGNVSQKDENVGQDGINRIDMKDDNSFQFCLFMVKNGGLTIIKKWLFYLLVHGILSLQLALIFKWTSQNRYWYLWKNYWKNHFNNFGSFLIFLLMLILWPCFLFMFSYGEFMQEEEKKKQFYGSGEKNKLHK
ncbi:MAG: hypothetical protein J6Y70_00955 [Bacilli bacterium]|nr:hypothetical protein [Bacilli bacterium]